MNQQNPQQQRLVQVDSDSVHKRRVLSVNLHNPARLLRVLSQLRRLPHSAKQHRLLKRLLGNRPLAPARRHRRLGRQVPLESQRSDRRPLQYLGSPLCRLPPRFVVVITLEAADLVHSVRKNSRSSVLRSDNELGFFLNNFCFPSTRIVLICQMLSVYIHRN